MKELSTEEMTSLKGGGFRKKKDGGKNSSSVYISSSKNKANAVNLSFLDNEKGDANVYQNAWADAGNQYIDIDIDQEN
jgi:hypothetical protein